MELLALRWQDIDFKQHEIHVRAQLRRKGGRKELKTDVGRRDVVLMPELALCSVWTLALSCFDNCPVIRSIGSGLFVWEFTVHRRSCAFPSLDWFALVGRLALVPTSTSEFVVRIGGRGPGG